MAAQYPKQIGITGRKKYKNMQLKYSSKLTGMPYSSAFYYTYSSFGNVATN